MRRLFAFAAVTVVVITVVITAASAAGAGVAVRHREGLLHGFLVLRAQTGAALASGDLIQNAHGNTVTSRLVFHFHDGSLYDETTVYSQAGRFRLIRDHLVERGPSFPRPIDMSVDATRGNVAVRYDDDGKEKVDTDHLDPVPDLANGMMPTLLKNVGTPLPTDLAMVVATPGPRIVKLKIASIGEEPFDTAGQRRTATHYVVTPQIGGLTGALAALFGKEPPESHVWILHGEAPAFLRSEQPLYAGGPLWRIELVSANWPLAK